MTYGSLASTNTSKLRLNATQKVQQPFSYFGYVVWATSQLNLFFNLLRFVDEVVS